MTMTTYGSISQRTAAWAAVEMLKHAEPIIVLGKFGETKPIPKNKADNAKFRRPVPFNQLNGTLATVPLIEGVTPASRRMQYEDVSVTLKQYGDIIEITDKVADLAEDPVLADASRLAGEQAAETLEFLLWGVLRAGTNVAYANGTARTDVNTVIAVADLRSAVRSLRNQRAKPITMMLAGSPNYATKPIEGGFIAFAHTDCENDIRELTGFTPVAAYGSRKPLCPEELGSVENIRFILSPILVPFEDAGGAKGSMKSTTGTSADVYPVIIVGQGAFGQTPLKGSGAIDPRVISPDTPDKSDPLGQRGYVSWKTWWAAVILNELWMVRIEVAVTAL